MQEIHFIEESVRKVMIQRRLYILCTVSCNELGNILNVFFYIIIHRQLDAKLRWQRYLSFWHLQTFYCLVSQPTHIFMFVHMSVVFKTVNFAAAAL